MNAITKTETLTPINPEALTAAQAVIPTEVLLNLVIQTFQALGDPTRTRILYALIKGPLCVRDLAILTGVSESAVSHQLRLLRDRQLVKSERDGNIIYYSLKDPHVAVLFREAEFHADHVYQDLPDHPYPIP